MIKINKICPVCTKEFNVPKCHSARYITCSYKCGGIYRRKPIITNKCLKCGIEFISKKLATKSQKFCSRKCSSHYNQLKAVAKNSKGEIKISIKIKRICEECNADFSITKARIIEGKSRGKFCSNDCRIKNWNRESLKREMPGNYKKNAWKIYEKKCYDCGITDHRILVIHHIDGNRKNGKIINLIPVCHNCHCIRHINLTGNHRLPSYRGE